MAKAVGVSILLTLASAIALPGDSVPKAKIAPDCAVELTLLDESLKGLLNELASLYVNLQTLDADSPTSITVKELIQKKSKAFESMLTDVSLRRAAEVYIAEQIKKLSNENTVIEEKHLQEESESRRHEEDHFNPFEVTDIKPVILDSFIVPQLTSDGLLIGMPRETARVLILDIRKGVSKRIELPARALNHHGGLKYAPGTRELFIPSESTIVIDVDKVLNSTDAVVKSEDVSTLIPNDDTYKNKINKTIGRTLLRWPKIAGFFQENMPGEFAGFNVSKDGKVIAQLSHLSRMGETKFTLLIYDRVPGETDPEKSISFRSKFTWNDSWGWVMSSSGQYLAVRDKDVIQVWDTKTRRHGTIKAGAETKLFGFSGEDVLYVEAPNKIITFNPLRNDAADKKVFENPITSSSYYEQVMVSPDNSTLYARTSTALWGWDVKSLEPTMRAKVSTNRFDVTDDQNFFMMYDWDSKTASIWKRKLKHE